MSDNKQITLLVPRKTNRLLYVLQHVFEYRLGCSFHLVTNVEQYLNEDGLKINYSEHRVEGEFHIIPSNILFEKRLQQPNVDVETHDNLPLILANATKELKHDVFGAIFFLLSRYEEYFPFRKDAHERFCSIHSLALKHDFLHLPLVDIYIERLAAALNKGFEQEIFQTKKDFQHLFTLDVDQLYFYKAKGLARSALGFLKDAIKNQSSFSERVSTVFGQKKDPNEIYDDLLDQLDEKKIERIFFFQVGDSSRFDINNPVHLPRVKSKINELSLRAKIGIHPSYFTSDNFEMMQREFDRFNAVSSTKLYKSRQHYLRFKLPQTFRQLESLGVTNDYSMAFPDANGFRASTCFPFKFYDLERDELTRLTVQPTCWLDVVSVRKSKDFEDAKIEFEQLENEVKKVGGLFISMWHPEVLNGFDVPFASKPIFDHLINSND